MWNLEFSSVSRCIHRRATIPPYIEVRPCDKSLTGRYCTAGPESHLALLADNPLPGGAGVNFLLVLEEVHRSISLHHGAPLLLFHLHGEVKSAVGLHEGIDRPVKEPAKGKSLANLSETASW